MRIGQRKDFKNGKSQLKPRMENSKMNYCNPKPNLILGVSVGNAITYVEVSAYISAKGLQTIASDLEDKLYRAMRDGVEKAGFEWDGDEYSRDMYTLAKTKEDAWDTSYGYHELVSALKDLQN